MLKVEPTGNRGRTVTGSGRNFRSIRRTIDMPHRTAVVVGGSAYRFAARHLAVFTYGLLLVFNAAVLCSSMSCTSWRASSVQAQCVDEERRRTAAGVAWERTGRRTAVCDKYVTNVQTNGRRQPVISCTVMLWWRSAMDTHCEPSWSTLAS